MEAAGRLLMEAVGRLLALQIDEGATEKDKNNRLLVSYMHAIFFYLLTVCQVDP